MSSARVQANWLLPRVMRAGLGLAQRRAVEDNRQIDFYMKHRTLFGRKLKYRTCTEVIAVLSAEPLGDFPYTGGWRDEKDLMKLTYLCEAAADNDGFVTLTADDWEVVYRLAGLDQAEIQVA